ncbi:MAG: DUF305 domain-containing protein [Gemmatimonadaceae bacterium]|nr:DUF305 domain-containing protein [Gemmatimonadaceae bacterium]
MSRFVPSLEGRRSRALVALFMLGVGSVGTLGYPAHSFAQNPPSSASHPGHQAQGQGARVKVTDADIAFVQGMIGHHGQALEMTALIADQSRDQTIAMLGERITVSQRDEIAMMSEWLRVRGLPVPEVASMPSMAGMSPDHRLMPGMLSAGQMDTLRAAKGAEFDRRFLIYMIQHHEGALIMVKQLMSAPGAAQEPQLFGFASDVDTDQRAEIRRMQALLAKYPSRPAARRR